LVNGQELTMCDIVWISPQSHSSLSVKPHFLWHALQWPWPARKRFSSDHRQLQAATEGWPVQRRLSTGDSILLSGRCTTDISVSTLNFREYCNLSVISWSHHLWSFQTHPPRRKQYTYSDANVLLGSVVTQLRWGGKLCIHI